MSDKLNSDISFHRPYSHKLVFITYVISLLYVQSETFLVTTRLRIKADAVEAVPKRSTATK
jgi:hypothetical protein